MGIFYLVADSFGDSTYAHITKSLMQRSPPTSVLRSKHVKFEKKAKPGTQAHKGGKEGDPDKHCVYHLPEFDEFGHLTWDDSRFRLPTERDKESYELRISLFKTLDEDGAGSLSLDELKGYLPKMVEVPGCENPKEMLSEAVDFANTALVEMTMGRRRQGDDITQKEFRLFLVYLQRYCDIYEFYLSLDVSDGDDGGDGELTLEEFTAALPKLKEAGWTNAKLFEDPVKTFQTIDEDGSGLIGFAEFANFCVRQGLDNEMDV